MKGHRGMKVITLEPLASLPGIRHGFFTRRGGVSDGLFASLNCGLGSGDDRSKVAQNRARAAHAFDLPAERLLTVYQIHSPEVVAVAQPWTPQQSPKADALATDRPGIMLGVLAADCAPVLLADPVARVVGAAHAGWRGAQAGVVDSAVAAMEKLGAQRRHIVAAIGPCIAQASYEVSDDFLAPFLQQDPANARFFAPGRREGKKQFDLPAYLAHRMARLGLGGIAVSGRDTQAEEDDFFSYRRATLRGERDYGRLLSAIALEP
ncbi:MAG: peptidoglycan editing factor PgeF [Reyranellaceae bacterium]